MNKIFKVVWSKTKECYVVVSEVAKNNGGKKKALSTVFAALVAAGAMIPGQVDAAAGYGAAGGTATGSDSVAIGTSAQATASNAVAVGRLNQATGASSVAVGVNNKAPAQDTTAVGSTNTIEAGAVAASAFGRENEVKLGSSIAAGYKNIVNGGRSVAVGNENTTAGEETIGIGTKVIAGTGKTIAIGNIYNPKQGPAGSPPIPDKQTIARGDDTVDPVTGKVNNLFALAIGNGAQADGKAKHAAGMIAIGQDVLADNNNTIAIGVQTQATGNNSTAIGGSSLAKGISSAAFGTQAVANGTGATAFGPGSSAGTGTVTADGSVAVGRKATVTAAGGVGIGWASAASEKNATAIGFSATASGVQSVAIGGGDEYDYPGTERGKNFTTASGKSSVAVGSYAKATAENAMAFGKDANANIAGGVALGSESKTTIAAGVTGYNPAAGRTNDYNKLTNNTNAALTSTRAAVSIGDDSASVTRQLTGLAAGTQDTDAVNVAQLKAVNLKYAADTGNSDVLLKDGTLTVKGDGDLISTDAQTNGVIKVTAKKGGTITNTDGKAVKPTTNGIATTDNVADAINNSYWKATAGGNTDGTPAVGNVKPGNQVTYSAGDNLKVKQTIAANGDQEYKYSLNPVLTGITSIANTATGPKMTFGGSSINITGGSLDMGNNKITSLATGTADTDAVNVKQLKDTELHITPGTYTPDANKKVKLTYTDGNNTVVTGKEAVIDLSSLATGGTTSTEKVQKAADATGDKNIAEVGPKSGDTFGAANATYEVSVSRNAVKDAAREAVTVNNGGNTDNPISVTPTPDNTNHNTTYAVTFDGNKAAKQIPLTYKANGTGDKTVKLDKGLDFTNGTNTTAEIGNDGVVKFNLNKDVDLTNAGSLTVGGTKVNNGGVTITAPAGGTTTDVKLTNTGLDNGGNKIVNVKDGDVNATSKDAVNGSQLYTVDQKFNNKINLGADGNTETTKLALDNASGIKFNIKGDGSGASGANQYISTTASGSDIKVDLTQDAKDKLNKTYEVKSTDHSVQVKSSTTNGVTTFDLKVAPATGTTSTWDIKSSADTANGGATATGHETAAKTIANANSVEMIAGKNLTVKQTSDTNGAKVEFALSDEIAVGKDGANGIDGKIGVNGKDGASVVINGKDGSIGLTGAPGTPGAPGASATLKVKDGVPGVDGAPGTNLTRIVYTDKNNVEHQVATHDDGMKFAGDDGQSNQATNANVIKKHLNNVVDIIGGATKADLTTNNIGVNNDGNGKLLVQLSKNLNGINTIKNGNTTITLNDAPGGAANTPAVTISGGNLSVGGNKVTNVDDGTNDSDAVNLKQLKAAKTEVKAGENVTVKHTTDATDNHNIYTVSAVTPAVYTKADGTKVYKIVDPTTGAVTWNTNPDGTGTVVNAGDVITSFESPANGTTPGSTTGGTMIVNNVGSAINGKTGATYLDKLNAAAGDNNTKHAAVNVTDLKSTADALTDKGLKFDANVGGVKTNKLGSIVKVQGAGASADADYSGANIKTFIDQDATGNTTIDVKLDKNLAGINSITGDTNSGKLVFQNPTATGNNGDAFKFTGGNINAGGNNITNLKSGIVNNNATDDTNGANIGDVKKIAKDTDLHIAPTAGTTNNVAEYTVDANNKVTLTYQDGNGTAVAAPKAVIDLSALANKITSGYTFNANAIANGGTVANDATSPAVATTVENGGTINYAAGKNLTVKQDIDATNKTHTYTYSLNKDLTNLDKVVVNGENGTNGKDGVTIIGPQGATGATGIPGTNGIDGKVGIAGKDGKDAVSISGKDGIGTIGLTGPQGPAGQDGRGVDITTDHGTQTLNKPEANNNNQSERIVYVPKDKDGNPLKDNTGNTIKREVATMDDGLKFTGNNESVENKHKLGSLVKVKGEGVTEAQANAFQSASGNIAVVADNIDTLTVKLNKNLTGINKVSNGNSSITLNDTPSATTPAVTISGGNLSMDGNKVTNVAPGTEDSDAVNYKQLKAAKTEVKAGDNVTVKLTTDTTDGHNIYTVNAVTPAVYTKADGTKVYKIVDPTTGAVTWNTKADGTGTNVNAGDVITSFETPANGTTPGSTTGGTMIVNNIGSAIKNQTGGDFLTKLDNANTATPNAAVNVSDLKSTADALKANERHIAPTTVAASSTETKGGTASGGTNVYKYDATNKTVTLTYNDGNGHAVTDTKAVIDFSNLSTGGTGASSWNIASDKVSATEGAVAAGSAGTQNIADGKTVTMKAGKNLTVNQANDGAGNASVAFSLDKNLENLDKVVVNGNDGTTGKAGVSIVGPKGANGVDGNDGKVGIAGKDGKDAVSISGKDGVGHIGLQGPKGTPGTPGADGANLDITTDHGTQTLVKPEANNNNQSERIVYVPKDANGNPLKDTDGNTIKREVATMDDGLKFTGNNTATENKHKLGSLVKVQGEGVTAADEAAFQSASGNIAVTADGTDTLTIRLNKNLKGLNSIQLGDNTIKSNGDNIEFTTKGGTTKTVATTDQLWTIQANGTDVPATNGKVNVVGKDGITVAKNAAGNLEISGAGLGTMNGFDVTANNGATTKTITDGKKVDFNAGSNLTVKQTNDANGTHIEYALNKDVDLGNTGSLKIGDTTINNGGLTIANGPSITNTGVDAGNKKITNVADGDVNATSKDAVNGSQLKKYTDAAKTTVQAGDTNVKVDTDNSAADGHTNYKVSLKPVVEIGDTHKVKIDGHTGDITGLTNVNLNDPTFATKGRAATEEQLKQVLTEANKKAVEKVQAGTAAAGDTNIATVAPKAGDTFGAAGATYEVSVSKNAVKDAAKEAVKVTSVSPAITVTPDTSVAHETTYKVGFDGNQAATQIPLTYKQNGASARTVKLSDGLNFIDGTNTKARTAADGKVTFDVMGDLTGITSISNAAGGPKMTFGGNSINVTGGNLDMGGKKITNIGKGTDGTDAVNLNQLKDARTTVGSRNNSVSVVRTENASTGEIHYDLAVAGTPGAPATDPRVDMLGEEINRVGAQGAALSALKPIQYDPLEPTQIMAGYGNYRGTSAIAMGVAHYKNESTLIHGGISWAGGSSHMMANAGVTWKVANRDSEAAVADRYRKGPISSTYAMQQEMAAMKAQNAGLKGEVSDLKAENEQMKAQIAAMMAKLGL